METDVPSITVNRNENNTYESSKTSTDAIAIKLNRLTEKCCRFTSHKEFLVKCKASGQIPTGLQLTLEPSIGNHDEEFLKLWYEKLDACSIVFMDMVTEFCVSAIDSIEQDKRKTKEALNKFLEEAEFNEVIVIIDSNEKETTQALQQRKMKKFNYLKYHKGRAPQPSGAYSRGRENSNEQKSYADATKSRNRRDRSLSNKRNFSNTNLNKENPEPKPSTSKITLRDKIKNQSWRAPRRFPSNT